MKINGRLTVFLVPIMVHPWTPTAEQSVVPIHLWFESGTFVVNSGLLCFYIAPFRQQRSRKSRQGMNEQEVHQSSEEEQNRLGEVSELPREETCGHFEDGAHTRPIAAYSVIVVLAWEKILLRSGCREVLDVSCRVFEGRFDRWSDRIEDRVPPCNVLSGTPQTSGVNDSCQTDDSLITHATPVIRLFQTVPSDDKTWFQVLVVRGKH